MITWEPETFGHEKVLKTCLYQIQKYAAYKLSRYLASPRHYSLNTDVSDHVKYTDPIYAQAPRKYLRHPPVLLTSSRIHGLHRNS